jgi:hypothetical protein
MSTAAAGHYWVILEPGVVREVAYFDGDDWWAVGCEWSIEPKAVLSERLEPPTLRVRESAEAST